MFVAALLAALLPPVGGDVVRPFDYGANPFSAGQHRGIDLAARPGERVRAPCSGDVVAAGVVAGERVVSLDCGRDRVSLLGVAAMVEAGERVVAGERIGSVAARGEHGARASGGVRRARASGGRVLVVHLGLRRARDRFAYRDPAPLLASDPPPSPPFPPAAPVRPKSPGGPQRPHPSPAPPPRAAPHAPAAAGPPAVALAGLALLVGAATAGAGRRARSRRRDLRPSPAWNRASA